MLNEQNGLAVQVKNNSDKLDTLDSRVMKLEEYVSNYRVEKVQEHYEMKNMIADLLDSKFKPFLEHQETLEARIEDLEDRPRDATYRAACWALGIISTILVSVITYLVTHMLPV